MERFAPAKLNLTLDVLGKRPDGYHDLKMVMQSITLGDTLTLEPGGEGVRVQTDLHFLPTGPKNLAAAAALRFYETLGRPVPGTGDLHPASASRCAPGWPAAAPMPPLCCGP